MCPPWNDHRDRHHATGVGRLAKELVASRRNYEITASSEKGCGRCGSRGAHAGRKLWGVNSEGAERALKCDPLQWRAMGVRRWLGEV